MSRLCFRSEAQTYSNQVCVCVCNSGGQTGRSDIHLIIPPSDRGHTLILETQTHTDVMESDWKDGKLKGEEDEGDIGGGETGGQKKIREARRMRVELTGC